ncbi:MAG TPA: hypothetical protein VLE53_04950 [Gemmatimonadaceae bacterium]|nr:hypothetical protein [Gemmatimonadaceae bacterium]
MRIAKRIIVLLSTSLALGCVPMTTFNEYKAEVRADGDAVEAWIAATHQWIVFINANIATMCPGCSPPGLPPSPPPDGDWGT